jgi:ATP-dependent RNA helicase DeaD
MPEQGSEVTDLPTITDYVSDASFEDLGLSEELRRGIQERGYSVPTPVQARAIPSAIAGKDLIVRSKTGTGKTAAFGIPILERIPAGAHKTLALVLCPTRELAIQVAEELTALSKHKDLRVAPIYGGAPMKQQIDQLAAGAEVVVGTPGRVYDHIRRGNLDLSEAKIGVLDEADEMLNQGFYEEVTRILEHLPESRQTLLFSATVTPDIDRLIRRFTKDPETILLSGDVFTVEGIENIIYYTVDAYPKPRNLIYLLELEQPDSAIIFCNTRDDTSLVTAVLNRNGFDAEVLNGDLPQKERERVMAKVKRGELTFLVATDIAARGIDISDLSHVINYSLPEDPAVYLHRVGRTGRIGKKGVALSLVSGRELVTLTALEKRYSIKFEERKLPSPEEARRRWSDRHLTELRDAGKNSVFEAMLPLAADLKAVPDGEQLIAFLLKYFFTHQRIERARAVAAAEERAPQEAEAQEPRAHRERPSKPEVRRERKERRPRSEQRAESESPATETRGIRLWCNLGTMDNLDATGISDLLAAQAGVDRSSIAVVEPRTTHSYLFVAPEAVDTLVALTGKEHNGKQVKIEKPRSRR